MTADEPDRSVAGWWVVGTAVLVSVAAFAAVLVVDGRDRSAPEDRPAAVSPADPGWPSAVGSWGFDEASGAAAADAGGADARSALTRRPGTSWTDGRAGTALLLDGIAGYATTDGPVVDTSGSYTVAAWVRLDVPGRFSTAVSQDAGAYSAFFLQYTASQGRFSFSVLVPGTEQAVRALAADPPRLGRWQHLVGVRDADAGTVGLYVDGVRQASTAFAGRVPSGGPFAVGRARYRDADVDFWPGAVDGVHAYAAALTAGQVRDLYRSGR